MEHLFIMKKEHVLSFSEHAHDGMTPKVGLEPTTDRLTADCSTTELLRNNFGILIS